MTRHERRDLIRRKLEMRLELDAMRRGPPDRVRRIPRHARPREPYNGCACPVDWGEFGPGGRALALVEDADGSLAAALRAVPLLGALFNALPGIVGSILSPPTSDAIDAGLSSMNQRMAESRGDPWPPVHRKPLQHRPGCRDAACDGCRE